jgi:hypothetical protein
MGGSLKLERNKPCGTVARVLLSAPQAPPAPLRAEKPIAAKQTV